jgi:hypothetical protein
MAYWEVSSRPAYLWSKKSTPGGTWPRADKGGCRNMSEADGRRDRAGMWSAQEECKHILKMEGEGIMC